jgi:hypothetical protein
LGQLLGLAPAANRREKRRPKMVETMGVAGVLARLVAVVDTDDDVGDEYGSAVDEARAALARVCSKCDGPIPAPLGVVGERCPLCGDEPPTGPELAELLQVAMRPLVALRDRVLDVEGMAVDDRLRDAALDVDHAFDCLDSALKWLEQIAEDDDDIIAACRFCDGEGPTEGSCCDGCFDVLADAGAWSSSLDEQRALVRASLECRHCGAAISHGEDGVWRPLPPYGEHEGGCEPGEYVASCPEDPDGVHFIGCGCDR